MPLLALENHANGIRTSGFELCFVVEVIRWLRVGENGLESKPWLWDWKTSLRFIETQ